MTGGRRRRAGVTTLRLPETAPRIGVGTSFLGIFRAFPTLIVDRGFVVNVIALVDDLGAFFGFIAAAPFIVVETMGRGPDVYGAYFILKRTRLHGRQLRHVPAGRETRHGAPGPHGARHLHHRDDRAMALSLTPVLDAADAVPSAGDHTPSETG